MEHLPPKLPSDDAQDAAGGMGYLVVRAATAGGAIPLQGASVRIWDSDYGDVRYILTTDRDGNTPRIPLPAPRRVLSYTPGTRPYAYYHIRVSNRGYFPMEFVDVPLYDTITSIQTAHLIPLPEGAQYQTERPLFDRVDEKINPTL